jgi:hypothetical protein
MRAILSETVGTDLLAGDKRDQYRPYKLPANQHFTVDAGGTGGTLQGFFARDGRA